MRRLAEKCPASIRSVDQPTVMWNHDSMATAKNSSRERLLPSHLAYEAYDGVGGRHCRDHDAFVERDVQLVVQRHDHIVAAALRALAPPRFVHEHRLMVMPATAMKSARSRALVRRCCNGASTLRHERCRRHRCGGHSRVKCPSVRRARKDVAFSSGWVESRRSGQLD